MAKKILSVFIDESGDFGPYEAHTPHYLVAVALQNQDVNISDHIASFDTHLQNLGYAQHAVHTGPLIRRESVYKDDLIEQLKNHKDNVLPLYNHMLIVDDDKNTTGSTTQFFF